MEDKKNRVGCFYPVTFAKREDADDLNDQLKPRIETDKAAPEEGTKQESRSVAG